MPIQPIDTHRFSVNRLRSLLQLENTVAKLIWSSILVLYCLSFSGCVIVDVGVSNPNPEISSIMVVPFFNQSSKPSADGRRIAMAYSTELQKVHGFQVVPVGVAENAIIQHQLKMYRPADVIKLAELLNVDAIVIGSITDYDPYYPPRLGLHVEWYSPHQVQFQPGVQIDPDARKKIGESIRYENPDPEYHRKRRWFVSRFPLVLRGQSPDSNDLKSSENQLSEIQQRLHYLREKYQTAPNSETGSKSIQATDDTTAEDVPINTDSSFKSKLTQRFGKEYQQARQRILSTRITPQTIQQSANRAAQNFVNQSSTSDHSTPNLQNGLPVANLTEDRSSVINRANTSQQFSISDNANPIYEHYPPLQTHRDPLKPFMSYSRIFEGSDAAFTAALRNHLELTGDIRSGGWKNSLQRTEDFIRFSSHLMIKEMLMLHGGESRRRIVFKHRKYK